jgi:hypothetical protein
MKKSHPITQEMISATDNFIESAVSFDDIQGLLFITVFGGLIKIYNSETNQTLNRKRFYNLETARAFAIARLVDVC